MGINAVFELTGECAQSRLPGVAVRVWLVSERASVARQLGRLLAEAGGTEAPAGIDAEERPPTVLLLDCPSLEPQGLWRLQQAARKGLPERVLWYLDSEPAGDDRIQPVIESVKRGWCHGYVAGDISPGKLARAVCAVAQGDIWLPRTLLARAILASPGLHADLDVPAGAAKVVERNLTQLTMREREILRLVRRGLTNKEIGRYLGIMEDTVKKHLRNMYAKLGVHRRAQMLLSVVGQARSAR